ncbi:uncharacterized protein Z519_10416 [Cladophialophora bantiana CBS 173.52]|uniref:Major facilitator superfamily (MFS) profile domain-containing protein n=1 Tax=Cladophialophora bantiana (strain ATCC 10958 / CBS 173.52 / CDC B-1940 / NIH 8579) TaxID=1442370 RepID=A0A0D2FQT6_CLAB1|nr:uncharacterized protein Z519_10416 [Cladophialophora bantiana CBS 173.52]KIW88932.1 hypothetical protein Z519_10416 [Cladophialophora bantiana CBS 173.52]
MAASEKPQVATIESTNSSDFVKDNAHAGAADSTIHRDRHGLPLVPQPSDDPLDPLNWKLWIKLVVLGEVSLLSFLALLSASLITPAFIPLSLFLHRGLVETAFVTSTFVACVGVSTIVWNPISNVYGRRPVYIITVAISIGMSVASGKANNFGQILTFRALNGFFGGVPLGLGSATVSDLFFTHERGFYMGIYTVSFILGGHVAPIIGGYIEKDLTWHWCFYIPAIVTAAVLVLFTLTVPETLYSRAPEALARPRRTWLQNMLMQGKAHPTRCLRIVDFFRPIQMLQYPSVLLPTISYAVSFAYGSILFIITSANLFGKTYHFHPQQTGLLLGIPITVGSVIGEAMSGGFSDWVSERRAIRRGGERKPEDRLLAMFPAFILTPIGIIIEGICLEKKMHWIGVAFGIAVASVGLQISTTVVYTYTAECYKPQSPEIGSLLNFARQIYSFAMGFYAIPWAERIGLLNAWVAMALIDVAFFLPVILLLFKAEDWRSRLGEPKFHRDL